MTDTASAAVRRAPDRPVRVGVGAVTTTVACVLPVFLVGGLAVQMGAELPSSPPTWAWPSPSTSG